MKAASNDFHEAVLMTHVMLRIHVSRMITLT